MLIPRFTIRWLLTVTAGCGVISLIVRFAIQGRAWAIALSAAVASLAIAFLGYAALFALAYIVATIAAAVRRPARDEARVATAAPPPQIFPPEDPE